MSTKKGAIRLTRPPDSKVSGDPYHIFTFDHIYDPGFDLPGPILVSSHFFAPPELHKN